MDRGVEQQTLGERDGAWLYLWAHAAHPSRGVHPHRAAHVWMSWMRDDREEVRQHGTISDQIHFTSTYP